MGRQDGPVVHILYYYYYILQYYYYTTRPVGRAGWPVVHSNRRPTTRLQPDYDPTTKLLLHYYYTTPGTLRVGRPVDVDDTETILLV